MNTILFEEFDASATIHARLRCLMCNPVSVWESDAYPCGYTRGEKTWLVNLCPMMVASVENEQNSHHHVCLHDWPGRKPKMLSAEDNTLVTRASEVRSHTP